MTNATTNATTYALTYAERALVSGNFEAGFLAGWHGDKVATREARKHQRVWRINKGFSGNADVLGKNKKLDKSDLTTYGFSLMPARGAGIKRVNVCPWATKGCEAVCLASAGNGRYDSVTAGRTARTEYLFDAPYHTAVLMGSELRKHATTHGRIGFRPNVLSDLRWELIAPNMIDAIRVDDVVSVYDYTKATPAKRNLRADYPLTFSAHENMPESRIVDLVLSGHNVAVPVAVTPSHALPSAFRGLPAIDGDKSDLRSDDPRGVVVLLRAKGDARGDDSGFVRQTDDALANA